jgi:hypothetical protein
MYRSSSKWNQQRKRDAARSRREREKDRRESDRIARQTPQQNRSGFYDMDVLADSLAEEINARLQATGQTVTLTRITCTLTGKQTAEYHASYSDGDGVIEPVRISADGELWRARLWPELPDSPSFAAIAVSSSTEGHGCSWGHGDPLTAQAAALEACGAGDAHIIATAVSAWIALAENSRGWGTGLADTQTEAEQKARQDLLENYPCSYDRPRIAVSFSAQDGPATVEPDDAGMITEREEERESDGDSTHAYCDVCSRRVYGGETRCQAGHPLKRGWEDKFFDKFAVGPEKRPGGAPLELTPVPNPYDQWLNELAGEFDDRGFAVTGRNLDQTCFGIPVEAQLRVRQEPNFVFYVTLFASADLARSAHEARRDRKARRAISGGYTVIDVEDRVLFVANGKGARVDLSRFASAVSAVVDAGPAEPSAAPLEAEESPTPIATHNSEPSSAASAQSSEPPSEAVSESGEAPTDPIEQLRRLAELRDAGVITESEFDAKKTELLSRI